MNYWIFKCDRINKYDLDARLKNTEEDNTTWRVDRRYKDDVQPGDTAFIWQIGENKGVRAIMRVTSKPDEMDEIESEKQYYRPSFEPKRMMRVTGKLLARFPVVSARNLKENNRLLSSSSAFHGFPGKTTYTLTKEQGEILDEIMEKYVKGTH